MGNPACDATELWYQSEVEKILAGDRNFSKRPSLPRNGEPEVREILSVPLIVRFSLILGLSSACAIPAPLRANWVFRFHINSRSRECVPLARKIALTFVAPALAICLAFLGVAVDPLRT